MNRQYRLKKNSQITIMVSSLDPNTPVRTPNGFINIRDLNTGECVLTSKGFGHILDKKSRLYSGKMVEITALKRSDKFPLRLMPECLVLTKTGWKSAIDVGMEDELALADDSFGRYCRWNNQRIDLAEQFNSQQYCRTETEIWIHGSKNKTLRRDVQINKDFAELYGIYLAEGSASKKGIVFSISQDEQELTDRIVNLVKLVWGLDKPPGVEDCPKSRKRWVRVYSKILEEFYAKSCGSGARNKRIGLFDRLTRHTAAKVLKGIWLGDGSDETYGYEITTCSREMALQIIALGDRLKMRLSLEWNSTRDSYRIRTGIKFAKNFSLILDDGKFTNRNNGKPPRTTPIKLIKCVDYSGDVFNIQVDKAHDFMTHHCLVHTSILTEKESSPPSL